MSNVLAQDLESSAARHASEAVRFEEQGARGMAITMYQRATESLLRLVQLYPDFGLNRIYVQRAEAYKQRIRLLQGSGPLDTEDKVAASKPQPAMDIEPTNRMEPAKEEKKVTYDDLVMKEKPDISWDQVIGLGDAKRAIREAIIYPKKRPDLFPLGWPRGLLLFGPPGCGKTLLAAAVATECNAMFMSVDAASIMSKWLGEAERNVAKLFAQARQSAGDGTPAILFVDELDSILGVHSSEVGGEVRVRNQFLKEMDGVSDKGKKIMVYVIGATNKPWVLDWPFIRRFQKRIMVPVPENDGRLNLLKLYTKDLRLSDDVDLSEIAKRSDGYSGSDMLDLCQSVQLKIVREFFESGQVDNKANRPRQITMRDFLQVLEERKRSVSPEMMKAYITWYDNFKAL
ncbi:MAG TPA: AAA family ATPase [Candidatus Bathyarchaeia archaeon]|nr:AAA family ATPase [Candidatus Bathyarchaeia archaeon]